MAKSTVKIPNLQVVYKDMFVLQYLYRAMRLWLIENEYVDLAHDEDLESNMEILYWYKRGTTENPNEKEARIWWRLQKAGAPVSTGGSAYYKHHLDIDINIVKMVDMEIMKNGKKEKVQHGEVRIVIRPYFIMPDFKKVPILKYFDMWFRTRLLKKNIEEQRKILYQDAYLFQGMIKKYLELKSFMPEEELFHEKTEFI
jgi:hypothetical protein